MSVLVITVVGVVMALAPGPKEPAPSVAKLSAAQYRGAVGAICSEGTRRAERIQIADPQGPAVAAGADIERDQVVAVKRLSPPDEFKVHHDEMVAVWERRISLLDSYAEGMDTMSDKDKYRHYLQSEEFNAELTTHFEALGVKECVM